jgi:hypothetical protein
MELHTERDSKSLSVDIITVRTRDEYKTTHTSHEHSSVGYDDTFYEECVIVILHGILCCFMSFYVVRFKLCIALLRMNVHTRNWYRH